MSNRIARQMEGNAPPAPPTLTTEQETILLKAAGYDTWTQIQAAQARLQQINQRITELATPSNGKPAEPVPAEDKD